MPDSQATSPDNSALSEAAAWRIALSEHGVESSAAFERWLAESPANAAAWKDLSGTWAFFEEQATAPELMDARRRALENARRQSGARHQHSRFAAGWRRALAASVAALMVLSSAGYWYLSRPDTYETALGERRKVTLADGSVLTIDSGSLLKVRLGKDARRIELLRGQARFDVAHDTLRPFSVKAGDETVVATGTSFDVDLSGSMMRVTLIEGRVVVLSERQDVAVPVSGARPDGIHLAAGEQFTSSLKIADDAHVAKVDLEKATSWESGKLMFDDEKLSLIVERVNRYSAERIVIDDEAAGQLTISGVFNTGDTEALLSTLTAYLPVIVTRDAAGTVRVRSRR